MALFKTLLQIFFALLILFALFAFVGNSEGWESVWNYRKLFIKGWFITIAISFGGLVLSLLLGFLTALAVRSKMPFFVGIAQTYIEIIRGTPLLVQILFFYYVVAHQIGLENRFIAGVLILSIFHGAYIAEMIRGGLEAVSKTQKESAMAIGLSPFQTYRFVIIPQAIRQVIPPLTGQFASIIKDSSLLSVIGINELTHSAEQINSATYSTLEIFLPLGLAYLILTLPISLWSKRLEKKFQYET